MPLEPGPRLGHYQLLGPLGTGVSNTPAEDFIADSG